MVKAAVEKIVGAITMLNLSEPSHHHARFFRKHPHFATTPTAKQIVENDRLINRLRAEQIYLKSEIYKARRVLAQQR